MSEASEPLGVLVVELPESLGDVVRQGLIASGVIGFEEEDSPRPGYLRWLVWCASEDEATQRRDALSVFLQAASVLPGIVLKVEPRNVGNWETAWLADLAPTWLTGSVRVDPTPGARPDAETLVLGPAVAFGYGEHPSTRLAATMLERQCQLRRGARVLDVGTGSGVLALLAARVGAAVAMGVDQSSRAVEAARHNAELNALGCCEFREGSAEDVPGVFEIVVANIEASVLEALADPLGARLADGGSLILSGFVDNSVTDVQAAFARVGLGERSRATEADWVCLELRRVGRERAASSTRRRSTS